ncbi:CobW family GTP-binding protein [Propionicicella superfundia]|uniref:CobW family GTP-binding protein n=1 Tax=Propionicicella superfundia TaxID=348582 RepID=UPI00048B5C31|nr:GTP-binding protein [Propionicicella superfundia]
MKEPGAGREDPRVPVVLVSGVAAEPMAAVTVGMQWDLPSAVVVRHEIHPEQESLVRTISDAGGLRERVEIGVAHACVDCSIREDIVPTLERLAATGRWGAIVAHLPVTAEATQVCRVLGRDPQAAPHARIAAVLVALDGETVREDLLGEDLLVERGLPVRMDDGRGVGETTSAMVEYADLVIAEGLGTEDRELIEVIARPDTRVVDTITAVAARDLLDLHHHEHSEDWVQVVRRGPLPAPSGEAAWVLDFSSDRPFHPDRLQERIATLGRGPRRSRGCFWLPSRPDQICQWDGAGGMVSIGPGEDWDGTGPLTRIVVIGMDDGRDELTAAFRSCLLTDDELAERGPYWEVCADGLEPWLGPVRDLMRGRP